MLLANREINSLCVFCASSSKVDEKYYSIAASVGDFCAKENLTVVYGGAQAGLMGRVADAALGSGGEVIGVMPEILSDRERAHKGLSCLYITKDMHERQKKMADLSDAFLILPGGLGTLAEFFEILTWKQIGLHEKPIFLLNIYGFWDPLLNMIESVAQERFLHENPSDLFQILHSLEDFQNFFTLE